MQKALGDKNVKSWWRSQPDRVGGDQDQTKTDPEQAQWPGMAGEEADRPIFSVPEGMAGLHYGLK